MLHELENKVLDFIREQGLLEPQQAVLTAVSGGADSMTLLAVLKRLVEEQALNVSVAVGHVNHRLRGAASDGDEALVKDAAVSRGFDYFVRSVEVRNRARADRLSIETAARQLRLEALIDMAKRCGAVATAHHIDDNVETVIHRLLRGTGFRGLAGIRPKRTLQGAAGAMTFVSPLLCVTRREIVAYCEDTGLCWRHDHTNDDCAHTRNRIRHALLPALRDEAGPNLTRQINLLSAKCRSLSLQIENKADSLYRAAARKEQDARVVIDRQVIASQAEPVAAELIRQVLTEIHAGLRGMSEGRYRAAMQQARTGRPGRLSLPDGVSMSLHKDRLCFERIGRTAGKAAPATSCRLGVGSSTVFGSVTFETALLDAQTCDLRQFKAAKDEHTEWFDNDKLAGPLIVRARRPGDRFHPLGMPGAKKVGKFLSAAHGGMERPEQIAILADDERIIWVAPVRACEQTRITAETSTILQVTMKRPCQHGPRA